MTTQAEARRYLFGLLPPGIEKLYDLEPGGDPYNLLDAGASLLRRFGFDLLDKLRREQFPLFVIDKLPDWERFLGLARFLMAQLGTISQRQQSVVSKIRERGPFIDSLTQAVIAPLLGYFPSTPLEILRTDRAALRIAHTYQVGATLADAWSIGASSTDHRTVQVRDGGKVAKMGARVVLELGAAGAGVVTLTGPDGTAKSWTFDGDGTGLLGFFGKEFAGAAITGWWKVTVQNTGGSPLPIIVSFFIEGIARNQDTAGAASHWGVYADPAHIGESGYSDFEAVMAAIRRIKHSHDRGRLILSKEPWPGVATGAHAAIPGRCIPSAAT